MTVNKEPLIGKKGKLFLITKNWGLTGDKQLSIISTSDEASNDLSFDSTTDYVYKGLEPFIYKFENDTLFIYNETNYIVPKPAKFLSPIVVEQIYMNRTDYSEIRKFTGQNKSKYKFPGETIDKPKIEGPPPPPFK